MITVFPQIADINIIRRLVKEHADRYYPQLPYLQLDEARFTEYDELHDEVPQYSKRWKEAVLLRAYVIPADQTHLLSQFGIEEQRDLNIVVDVRSLTEVHLATEDVTTRYVSLSARPGDRVIYSMNIYYDVLEWKIGKTWANTDIPLYFSATADRVREESTLQQER